jgi:hypothetical protein
MTSQGQKVMTSHYMINIRSQRVRKTLTNVQNARTEKTNALKRGTGASTQRILMARYESQRQS